MVNEHDESPEEEDNTELPPPAGGENEIGEECEECSTLTTTGRRIDRVWVWLNGDINDRNRYPETDTAPFPEETRRLAEDVVSLNVSDVVILLNNWRGGTNITRVPDFSQTQHREFQKIYRLHRFFRAWGITVHYMVFLIPEEEFINHAAENVGHLVTSYGLVPRSVHLDIEHWWFRHPGDRTTAQAAMRAGFVNSAWSSRVAMGVGITAAALPQSERYMTPDLQPLLNMLDFAIPQMYASISVYGSSCGTIRTRAQAQVDTYLHYLSAPPSTTLPIVAGQTCDHANLMRTGSESQEEARGRIRADPSLRQGARQRMQNMIDVLLALGTGPSTYIREISFWSNQHLQVTGPTREFVTYIANLARTGGLVPGFAPPPGLTRECSFPP